MKKMKRVIAVGFIAIMMSSCATVFGGKVTAHQKTKPAAGEQQREVRVVALIADILLFAPGLIVDFATGAIYKPQK
jgi:PBP1b-binding outer membrane lipoprotein LpoB